MRTTEHLEPASERLSVADKLTSPAFFPTSDSERGAATASSSGVGPVYDLRLDEKTSSRFYADVAAFSARTLREIERQASGALDGYSSFVTAHVHETPRSRGEHGMELLTLGMALRLYGGLATETPAWVIDVCRELFCMRRRLPRIKPVIDWMRAGVFQIFLQKKLRSSLTAQAGIFEHLDAPNTTCLATLPRLIEWMHATGEFEQESRRLDNWSSYLRQLPRVEAEGWIGTALNLFDWFTREAESALGRYTAGVIPFLKKTYPARFWREDQIFCLREPVEYHLGMVAAEVMNDGLREQFLFRPRKVLLVPTCMRGTRADQCKAVARDQGIRCAGCDPACGINRITRRMRTAGVQVFMVPHASGFSRWLERWQREPGVGVAAVACMLNILPGGYEMRARGIASQCVPLDFPGCKKHWNEEGIPTSVNEERLVRIVASPRT
jgi:hypothetical protein